MKTRKVKTPNGWAVVVGSEHLITLITVFSNGVIHNHFNHIDGDSFKTTFDALCQQLVDGETESQKKQLDL